MENKIIGPSDWKTKTAGILGGIYGLVGMGLYFLTGPETPGALSPEAGIPMALAGFGLLGLADKIQKLIAAIKGQPK